jgi:DNA-binding MarR family transcriptional regulator
MSDGTDSEAKAFAAWKFRTIDLLIIGLPHREARVAVHLLSYMNKTTRLIFPSQRRIAAMLGMDESAVRRSIKSMVDIELLLIRRDNRQKSNRYEFSDAKLNEFRDLRTDREFIANLIPEREKVSAQIYPDRGEAPGPDEEEAPAPEREKVSAKLVKLPTEGNLEELGYDKSGYQPDELGDELREDASGEVSPQGERAGGGVRARQHVLTASLLATDIVRSRITDPTPIFDRIERQGRRHG